MGDAIYVLASGFLAGALGGAVCSLGLRWGINRRCQKLEWALLDVIQRLGTLHAKKAAGARWESQRTLEEELGTVLAQPESRRTKYDNDPLGG